MIIVKLRFADGYEITVQKVTECAGHLRVRMINMDREEALRLFKDIEKTKLITVVDKDKMDTHKKYTTYNSLTEHANGFLDIEMIQEGKSDTELIHELRELTDVLEQQMTDTQVALCEVYELIG